MILIVGCGFLGSYLLKYALSQTDEPVVATVRNGAAIVPFKGVEYVKLDVGCEKDLLELAEKTKGHRLKVFWFAASHNVDFVYENPDEARKINIDALHNFFKVFRNVEKFFFSSTDCVYGENSDENPAFREDCEAHPINRYGEQKLEAENIIIGKGFNVLRLPFMLGPSLTEKKHFYDSICERLDNSEETEMIDGMLRSVLSYENAAKLIYKLSCVEGDLPQIINVCGDEAMSKYETGCRIAAKKGAPLTLVKRISEEQGSKFFKDKRAHSAVMDNSLLKKISGLKEIPWEGDICW